jgi:DNA-binding NarL/FixJ family response regulator
MSLPRQLQPFAYHELMPYRVQDVLVVASAYDSYILEEEGRFSDRLLREYLELDLAVAPQLDHVTSARDALGQLRRRHYDLVVTTPHISGATPESLGAEISKRFPDLPVVLLTWDRADQRADAAGVPGVQEVFVWTGDPKLLLAIVKSVEDTLNADHDTRKGLVRVIVLVEDSPAFASSYLPIIYSELLEQVRSLLADRLNERERHYRMRARPKILLARTYEEGLALFRRYRENLLGLICDVRFPRGGELDPDAGIDLIRTVREELPDLPVLLQSRGSGRAAQAEELGVAMADKNSPELLGELREFMRGSLGFGPFVFRNPEGEEVGRVAGIRQMVEVLPEVPGESLLYHAERNHFSNWLMARSEFGLAMEVGPRQASEFASPEEIRSYLIEVFRDFVEQRQRGQVTEFARRGGALPRDFTRIGTGSMGGKGRGIAFVAHMLAGHPIHDKHPGVKIGVPRTAVVCTDWFDRFLARDGLRERAIAAEEDAEIARLFLAQPLEDELMEDLEALLAEARYPLAVRSSSLLEDSEFHPLAGLYKTFLLPNAAPSDKVRLDQLARAVRLVWASTFFSGPRTYMAATSQRLEEERMAVIVERLVGRAHGDRFYPDFAGAAHSRNYYPLGALAPEDGIATVALGLGETVVGGGRALRFSPRHPGVLPQMSTPADALASSQRELWALDLGDPDSSVGLDEAATLVKVDLAAAERDGTLAPVGATYSPDDDRIYDSIYRPGVRIVNFAGVLKHGLFPLAPLLDELLTLGGEGMATPVELEFAALLERGEEQAEMAVVQLRPLTPHGGEVEVELDPSGQARPRLLWGPALGNGVFRDVRDVVYLHPERCDFADSHRLAHEISRLNARLAREHRGYLLMGPGRWGTADPWLGIPVGWPEVSAARVIVELEVPGSSIESSQGSHFFHNITSLRIGYFCVDLDHPDQRVDFEWLETHPVAAEIGAIRHLVLDAPLEARIDGRCGRGVVLR